MHRDKTTGLALAILLIGFVSSLCFPRESDEPQEEEAPLKHEAIIQKRIDEGINRPYSPSSVDLHGVESVSNEEVVNVDESNGSKQPAGGWEFPKTESTVSQTESPSSDPRQPSIEEELNPRNLVPIPVPAHNEDWESEKTVAGPSESTEIDHVDDAADEFIVHKVQRGDTLSSLGSRYLGSSARFMEIFEANRGVLKSPSAIYVGMELRIPNRNRASNSTAKSRKSPKKSESANREQSKRTAKGRFIPARRSPFRAGQAIPRESASLQGKQLPIKKLSQVPPEDLDSN